MYKVGQKVKVSSNNDNENYKEFKNKILIITYIGIEHPYYDESMYPQKLLEFETIEGKDVPFALYEYEIEPI